MLGNALEGVPDEEEDEGKPKDSTVDSAENIDGRKTIFVKYNKAFSFFFFFNSKLCSHSFCSTDTTRDELRVQVYDAMAEKSEEKNEDKVEEKQTSDGEKAETAEDQHHAEKVENQEKSEVETSKSEGEEKAEDEEKAENEKEESDKEEEEAEGNTVCF